MIYLLKYQQYVHKYHEYKKKVEENLKIIIIKSKYSSEFVCISYVYQKYQSTFLMMS